VRRTELHCQGNSSGKDANVFYTVPNIKPPDFYEYANSQNAEECHQNCLHNCSCLAFSYIPGIGCLMWSKDLMDTRQFSAAGELLSIRLARSELGMTYNIIQGPFVSFVIISSTSLILMFSIEA